MIRRMGLEAAIAMLINSNDLNDFCCLGLKTEDLLTMYSNATRTPRDFRSTLRKT